MSDAFGISFSSSGRATNPFIWNGGSRYDSDVESGLQKVGARYYDPAVARWISQDTEIMAKSGADGGGDQGGANGGGDGRITMS